MKIIKILFILTLCVEVLSTIYLPQSPFIAEAGAATWEDINQVTPTGPDTEYPTVKWGS